LNTIQTLFFLYLPWVIWLGVCGVFLILWRWAKQKKASAFLFGAVFQMFLPDPQIEKTINFVQEAKQEHKEEQDQDDKLLND